MAYRILLEVIIFSLPFAAFGIYRLAVSDAEAEGRKAWPITALFITGLVLAGTAWVYLILREDRTQDRCFEPARQVDGRIVPGREYPCDKDLESVGRPLSDDPGRGPDEPQ